MPVRTPARVATKPIKCHLYSCSYRTDHTSNLRRHQLSLHAEWFYLPYLCTSCRRGYTETRRFEQHIGSLAHVTSCTGEATTQVNIPVLRQEHLAKVNGTEWRDALKAWSRAAFHTHLTYQSSQEQDEPQEDRDQQDEPQGGQQEASLAAPLLGNQQFVDAVATTTTATAASANVVEGGDNPDVHGLTSLGLPDGPATDLGFDLPIFIDGGDPPKSPVPSTSSAVTDAINAMCALSSSQPATLSVLPRPPTPTGILGQAASQLDQGQREEPAPKRRCCRDLDVRVTAMQVTLDGLVSKVEDINQNQQDVVGAISASTTQMNNYSFQLAQNIQVDLAAAMTAISGLQDAVAKPPPSAAGHPFLQAMATVMQEAIRTLPPPPLDGQ